MPEENINQEFILKKIDEIRNYLIEEINQNELMGKKHKKVCRVLNYIDRSLIAISTIARCVCISPFASLVGFSNRNYEFCNWIKKYKSINKKNKKKHDEII